MTDGNKIRCYVITERFEINFANKIEEFCKGRQIIDIKYGYAPFDTYVDAYSALIIYYIEH